LFVSRCYIPLQQHFSISFFASVQNCFPSFMTQQHLSICFPVNVHVIFGAAADATVAIAITARNGSHLVIALI
jgi:hypothetical protein